MAPDALKVEVIYADVDEQVAIELCVPAGTTVSEAIGLSGITERCRELSPVHCAVGIFGKVVAADTVLRAGDRVEIYRPLIADPKQVRRRRAAEKS